jgi:hypothetical protein
MLTLPNSEGSSNDTGCFEKTAQIDGPCVHLSRTPQDTIVPHVFVLDIKRRQLDAPAGILPGKDFDSVLTGLKVVWDPEPVVERMISAPPRHATPRQVTNLNLNLHPAGQRLSEVDIRSFSQAFLRPLLEQDNSLPWLKQRGNRPYPAPDKSSPHFQML